MCIISKESSKSPNISPINNSSSPVIFNAPRLSSGSSCSVSSVEKNYVDDNKELVDKLINQRNIKAEIDFTTKKYIANGDFGKVSSADLKNGSKVAIKEFKAQEYRREYNEDDISAKIWSEAANFINVQGNPQFVELLGIYINAINSPCLSLNIAMVMEYADGDLAAYERALVKNKDVKLSYENMRYIALEIFSIMEACKQFEIEYYDLHSGNVLVFDDKKKLKLTDLDGIKPFVDSHRMVNDALFLFFAFCGNYYGKSIRDLLRINPCTAKEECRNKLFELLNGDDTLCNIILKIMITYVKKSQIETNALKNMIDQLKSCEIEEFPTLKMTWG